MGAVLTLKLTYWLVHVPHVNALSPHMGVQGLGYHRACGYCPVGPIRALVLPMSFKQNTCIGSIEFCYITIVDVIIEAG